MWLKRCCKWVLLVCAIPALLAWLCIVSLVFRGVTVPSEWVTGGMILAGVFFGFLFGAVL